jgi:Uma2 family endonuclease
MSQQLAKHLITADEYEQMGRAGIFHADVRLELIEGEIYEMSPIGSPHAACVKRLSALLNRLFGRKLIIGTQDPVRLNDFSEPQPDIALLRWRDDFYNNAHPTPSDVLLIIEVADTTLETDRKVKIPLYAKAGIPEAWVVNLSEECIELYAEPIGGAYQISKRFARGEAIQSHGIEKLSENVSDILG